MIKIYDNVLTEEELKNFVSDINSFAGKIVCPHTDNLIDATWRGDTLNELRPNSQCMKGTYTGTKENKQKFRNSEKVKETLESRIHEKGHLQQWITKKHFPKSLSKIASMYPCDFAGFEWWCYDSLNFGGHGLAIARHIDCDAALLMLSGSVVYPDYTFLFYDDVDENLEGGDCIFYDKDDKEMQRVKPVANRLVVFSGGMPHAVETFSGNRRSYVFLAWKNRPREFM
jgi:predicted 2-oxoglutarate/Fe(II)-dependent dioxygenase YbiX